MKDIEALAHEIQLMKDIEAIKVSDISLMPDDLVKALTPTDVANVIAWPVVYFIMRGWLDSYEFRIDITPMIFIAAGLLAALLALACVAWQVLKVARASPIHALRYE